MVRRSMRDGQRAFVYDGPRAGSDRERRGRLSELDLDEFVAALHQAAGGG